MVPLSALHGRFALQLRPALLLVLGSGRHGVPALQRCAPIAVGVGSGRLELLGRVLGLLGVRASGVGPRVDGAAGRKVVDGSPTGRSVHGRSRGMVKGRRGNSRRDADGRHSSTALRD